MSRRLGMLSPVEILSAYFGERRKRENIPSLVGVMGSPRPDGRVSTHRYEILCLLVGDVGRDLLDALYLAWLSSAGVAMRDDVQLAIPVPPAAIARRLGLPLREFRKAYGAALSDIAERLGRLRAAEAEEDREELRLMAAKVMRK